MLTLILISAVCSTTGIAAWKAIEANYYKRQLPKSKPKPGTKEHTCICKHLSNQHYFSGKGGCSLSNCVCLRFLGVDEIKQKPIRGGGIGGMGL